MRTVRVRCTWQSDHALEVPDDTPPLADGDLQGVLDAADDDVTAATAELIDWTVTDRKRAD